MEKYITLEKTLPKAPDCLGKHLNVDVLKVLPELKGIFEKAEFYGGIRFTAPGRNALGESYGPREIGHLNRAVEISELEAKVNHILRIFSREDISVAVDHDALPHEVDKYRPYLDHGAEITLTIPGHKAPSALAYFTKDKKMVVELCAETADITESCVKEMESIKKRLVSLGYAVNPESTHARFLN